MWIVLNVNDQSVEKRLEIAILEKRWILFGILNEKLRHVIKNPRNYFFEVGDSRSACLMREREDDSYSERGWW